MMQETNAWQQRDAEAFLREGVFLPKPAKQDTNLRQEAIKSADVCLKYYEKHPEDAIFVMHIRSVQPSIDMNEFKLTLDKKIRSAENLSIRIGKDKVFCNDLINVHFRIKKTDKKTVWLTDVSDELANALNNAQEGENNQFESDKTFLVKRLKGWYENYGNLIKIPDTWSSVPVCLHPEIPVSENQQEAVSTALKYPFSYIWGAPGTGKTKHVLATCIYSCLKDKKKILLTAPTNVALDQSLSGVILALEGDQELNIRSRVLRLGLSDDGLENPELCEEAVYKRIMLESGQRITDALSKIARLTQSREVKKGNQSGEDYFPEMTSRQIKEEIKRLNEFVEDLRTKRSKAEQEKSLIPFIDEFDIIAATADACVYKVRPDGKFKPDHIFLDEAGYCSVIKGMTFTAFNCPFTLLGDHMQLPPVCDVIPKDGDDISKQDEGKLFLWKFSAIAMEQVIQAQDFTAFYTKKDIEPEFTRLKKSSLMETHRFGPKLAGVLANTVYDSSFKSSNDIETNIWVIDAPKREQDIGFLPQTKKQIRFSQKEEELILQIILNNINTDIVEEIGILTPYTEQRKQLQKDIGNSLEHNHYHNVVQDNIMSVHQSQGCEWNIVIVSVVDSLEPIGNHNDAWMMNTINGFPPAIKTINTAISRAKRLLIILCDINSWKKNTDQFITKLISIADEHQADDPLPIESKEVKETTQPRTEEKEPSLSENKQQPQQSETSPPDVPGYYDRTGKTAVIGNYPQNEDGSSMPIRWRILEEKDNKALLISDQVLDIRAFSEKRPSCFWGRSAIRAWLNSGFLQRAFTAGQRNVILRTQVNNDALQSDSSDTILNGSPTKDWVFLLSYLEAKQYFPDDRSRAAKSTAFVISQLHRENQNGENSKERWMLRSNSRDNFNISVVDRYGRLGRRCGTKSRRLVRPAIWVDLSKMVEMKIPLYREGNTKATGIINTEYLSGIKLDQLVAATEDVPAEQIPEYTGGFPDRPAYYHMIENELPTPWKEYFRLISLARGRPYTGKEQTEETKSLCKTIKKYKGLDQYAGNRAGGLLLYIRMVNHEYDEAEKIAHNLYERTKLPYHVNYVLVLFYLRTRRYVYAEKCINRLQEGYIEDPWARTWCEKAKQEYRSKLASIKPYMPADKNNQEKLTVFLKSIGIV